MSDLKFTEEHEWIRIEEDGTAVVVITDYAQDQLGELVFVELPEVGTEVTKGTETAVIESVKAAGELNAPVNGTVLEINGSLVEEPGKVNEDPTGEGWIIKMKVNDPAELDSLMGEAAYAEYISGLD